MADENVQFNFFSGDVKGKNGPLYFEYRVQSLFFLLYKNVQDCFSNIQNKNDKCGTLKPLTIMAIQSLPGQTRVLERFSTEHSQQFSQSAKYVSYLILLIQHLFPLKTNAFFFFNFFLGSAFFKRIQPELKKKKRISAMPW